MTFNNASIFFKDWDKAKQAKSHELCRRGIFRHLLTTPQRRFYDMYTDTTKKEISCYSARKVGKCLQGLTEILTPNGPVCIKDIKIGDTVYGYNKDGSISPAKVINAFSTGVKPVIEMLSGNKVVAEATAEHRWLTTRHMKYVYKDIKKEYDIVEELNTEKVLSSTSAKVVRQFIEIPCGDVNEPHAYAIGALFGDGCSMQGKNQIHVSSENMAIPSKIATQLGSIYYQNHTQNFTWVLAHEKGKHTHGRLMCNYYDLWLKDRYAHEKILDWSVINTWDRESCLQLLAGLVDTDGSIGPCRTGKTASNLKIQFCSQSISGLDVFDKLVYKLFQVKPGRVPDLRTKYKNGRVESSYVASNLHVARMWKELAPFLVAPQKCYSQEAVDRHVPRNHCEKHIGLRQGKTRMSDTYDITIDNETSLYVLAHEGLVTHNSFTAFSIACEFAVKNKKSIVRFVCPQLNQAKEIYEQIWREFQDILPPDIYPSYRRSVGKFDFANGSSIVLGGSHPDNIGASRGPLTHLLILDEVAEFHKGNFEYAIYSVLKPQMSTTGGRTLYFSTPPEDIDHPYIQTILPKLEAQDCVVKFTIYDNPLINEEMRNSIIAEFGGVNNKNFLREYMCQVIADNSRLVVPEFDRKLHMTDELPPAKDQFDFPIAYNGYRAGDFGVGEQDLTGILGAVYDHNEKVVYITEERLLYKPIIDTFVTSWNEVGDTLADSPEVMSTLDAFESLKVTLKRQEGLDFKGPRKGKVTDQIAYVRQLFESNKIKVHSSCVKLIEQLEKGIWKENNKEFARSETLGHLDLLACLVYLVRSIEWNRRPLENRIDFKIGSVGYDRKKR